MDPIIMEAVAAERIRETGERAPPGQVSVQHEDQHRPAAGGAAAHIARCTAPTGMARRGTWAIRPAQKVRSPSLINNSRNILLVIEF